MVAYINYSHQKRLRPLTSTGEVLGEDFDADGFDLQGYYSTSSKVFVKGGGHADLCGYATSYGTASKTPAYRATKGTGSTNDTWGTY